VATLATSDGVRFVVEADILIGRADQCDLSVDHPGVSKQHARLRWTKSAWHLRDLGSQNGTFVNRRRIAPGVEVPLRRNDVIGVGVADPLWVLEDATPPLSRAVDESTGEERLLEHGLLLLPSADEPLLTVFQDAAGVWKAETESVVFPVRDGQTVTVAGREWTLVINPEVERTVETGARSLNIRDLELQFTVSQAEERVELEVVHAVGSMAVPERKFHYLLLLLARQRLEDRAAGHEERECGWLERSDLYRMLRTDRESFNKDVSRARRQFSKLGVADARDLIDVWGDSRRIGVERLLVR